MIRSGDHWRYLELVKDLGVGFIQLLEPRPCGGYLKADGGVLLTQDDRKKLVDFFKQVNTTKHYRGYPLVHYVAYAESPNQCGCMMGGLSHLYIDSCGNVNPCVFLLVTFGNILTEDFETLYRRMRDAIPYALHTECPSLQLRTTLKEKFAEVNQMPVPYTLIEREWQAMSGESHPDVHRKRKTLTVL
jgi:hypothetical protein